MRQRTMRMISSFGRDQRGAIMVLAAPMMLILGGIPWNCYFQRVLSCRSANHARGHSILSGLLTIVLTIPPLLMGLVAFAHVWPPDVARRLADQPAHALPMIFAYVVPPLVIDRIGRS